MRMNQKEVVTLMAACWLVSALLQKRAHQALTRFGAESAHATPVTTRVEPSGLLGLVSGRAARAELTVRGGDLNRLQLMLTDSTRLPARIRTVVLHWEEAYLGTVGPCRAKVVLKDVRLDGWAVLDRAQAVIVEHRGGEAWLDVPAYVLDGVVLERIPGLSSAQVGLAAGHMSLQARFRGNTDTFTAIGELVVRDGSVIELGTVTVWRNGVLLPDGLVSVLRNGLNPLFDVEEMTTLSDLFVLTAVSAHDGVLRISAIVPPRRPPHGRVNTNHEQ